MAMYLSSSGHMSLSEEGEIGKYLRKGQHQHSAACGAVIGAYQAALTSCDATAASDFDDADMQMAWIKRQLAPHVKRIQQKENSMAALAKQAFELVKKQVLKVVNNDFGEGYLVLLGGIQINMPRPITPVSDRFLHYHHFLIFLQFSHLGRESFFQFIDPLFQFSYRCRFCPRKYLPRVKKVMGKDINNGSYKLKHKNNNPNRCGCLLPPPPFVGSYFDVCFYVSDCNFYLLSLHRSLFYLREILSKQIEKDDPPNG